ncbi:MAG: ShlB/FhaC/HecB family hemolysin secretion/activation protein [Rubrivivax sp.]|nr:ShlB/FhaC/HecB family hemolysin secretion/activation protein [Rubrivivax sp.]
MLKHLLQRCGGCWLIARGVVMVLACGVAALATAADTAPAVNVERFVYTGHTLLDSGQFDAVVAPFKGRRTLAELRRAAEAVQRLYAEAGYAGVVAYVPPQAGSEGTITIAIVEGRVARITVPGASAERAAAARASLPDLVEGRTPLVRRIDAQIEIANENPARRLQLLLKPGAKAGEIDAELGLTDGPASSVHVSLDDTGNQRTGRYRAGIGWQHADVSGVGDTLALQASTSPTKVSQVKVFSASYRRPFPAWLVVGDVYAATSDVDAGSSPTAVGDIRFNGRGNLAGIRATRYLVRSGAFDQRLGVALDWREYLNQCEIANLPQGACGPAEADVAVTPLTLDYSVRSTAALPWTLGLAVVSNLRLGGRHTDASDFQAVRDGARPAYTTLRLNGSTLVTVAQGWQLRARLAAQWTGDALVPGEQFGLGGALSVRGYDERELAGDSGVLASLELSGPELLPLFGVEGTAQSLRAFAFADGGRVSNQRDAPCAATRSRCSAASLGAGLQYGRPGVNGRIAVGTALSDGVTTERGDTRVHFQLNLDF